MVASINLANLSIATLKHKDIINYLQLSVFVHSHRLVGPLHAVLTPAPVLGVRYPLHMPTAYCKNASRGLSAIAAFLVIARQHAQRGINLPFYMRLSVCLSITLYV